MTDPVQNQAADASAPAAPRRGRGRPKKVVAPVVSTLPASPPPAEVPADPAELARPDMRAAMRADMRPEDSRAAAEARAAKIRENMPSDEEGVDDFYFDTAKIPAGWDYQYKRHSVFGKEDSAYSIALARAGWTPVPRERHPEEMPGDSTSQIIVRKGCVLMERPMVITEEAKAREIRRARLQVKQKEEQLTEAPGGQFGRDNKGNTLVKVAKSYEAIPIPKD